MTELVLTDRAVTGIAVVTLNRPEKYNALSSRVRPMPGTTAQRY
jgi:enoyl-CoA hydratase/carnithine racemase